MQHDLIVIGAGPAGLSFARALAGSGLDILLLEKLEESVLADPPYDGREIALTHHSVVVLEDLDIFPRIPAEHVSPIREARVLNGSSPYFLQFDHQATGKEALGYLVSNHRIRKAAYEAAANAPGITLRTGAEVAAVTTDDGSARVTLTDGERLEASLLVAADTRFSQARRDMGISASQLDFGRVMIVCQVNHAEDHHGIAYECFHYTETIALLPLPGRCSSLVLTVNASDAREMVEMDPQAFAAVMQERLGGRLGTLELASERYPYPLVAVYADRFVGNRFALVGDAAVGMHPVTAHGFNLGLGGASLLAGRIRDAHGRGEPITSAPVLKGYEWRHRRDSLPLYLATNAIARIYATNAPPARLARNLLLRAGNRLSPVKHLLLDRLTDIRAA